MEDLDLFLRNKLSDWWSTHYHKKDYTFEGYTGHYIENSTLLEIAKHFYELGLIQNDE